MNSLYDKLINQRTGLETKNAMFLENSYFRLHYYQICCFGILSLLLNGLKPAYIHLILYVLSLFYLELWKAIINQENSFLYITFILFFKSKCCNCYVYYEHRYPWFYTALVAKFVVL